MKVISKIIMPSKSCPFEKEKSYCVQKTFLKFSQEFQEGQLLQFISETYSRYDNLSIYTFQVSTTGQMLSLEILDNKQPEPWTNLVEEG